MNRKGYTLIELLAVVCIIAVLTTLALLAYTKIQTASLQQSYDNKILLLENAAYKYGMQNKDDVYVATGHSLTKSIADLVELGYITSDYDGSAGLINPITGNPMTETLTITYSNKKIVVIINNKTH